MSYTLYQPDVEADTTPITDVRVVVHTSGAAGPNTSDNHWSIYLLHSDRRSSTRINMRADFGNPTGLLEWTRLTYIRRTSAISHWDFPVERGITVLFIARLIYSLRRDRYEMSGGGSGCRWWVYTIVSDIARRNYINRTAPNVLWPNLQYLYHTRWPRSPIRMVRGYFY